MRILMIFIVVGMFLGHLADAKPTVRLANPRNPSYPSYPPQFPSYPSYPPHSPSYPSYPPQFPSYPSYPGIFQRVVNWFRSSSERDGRVIEGHVRSKDQPKGAGQSIEGNGTREAH
ncbi:MAG: hypothetical protein AB7K68_04405 [Bacteriovoracia bacterium]